MTDIIDRLRLEAQREPHEPIWREAIEEIQSLRVSVEALELMTFDEWLKTLSLDSREDLDVWSAQQGWNAAMKHMKLDLESLDLLRKMQTLPQHEESK